MNPDNEPRGALDVIREVREYGIPIERALEKWPTIFESEQELLGDLFNLVLCYMLRLYGIHLGYEDLFALLKYEREK